MKKETALLNLSADGSCRAAVKEIHCENFKPYVLQSHDVKFISDDSQFRRYMQGAGYILTSRCMCSFSRSFKVATPKGEQNTQCLTGKVLYSVTVCICMLSATLGDSEGPDAARL